MPAVGAETIIIGLQFLVCFFRKPLAALGAVIRIACVHLAGETGSSHAVERVESHVAARSGKWNHAPLVLLGPLVGVELSQ